MKIRDALSGSAINWKEFAPAFIVAANSLIWYTVLYAMFNSIVTQLPLKPIESDEIFGAFYVAIAFSAVIGGKLFPRARKAGLAVWMVFGAASSILMITMTTNQFYINILYSILLGASIGIGLPSALAFFADSTHIEKRGFQGGIT